MRCPVGSKPSQPLEWVLGKVVAGVWKVFVHGAWYFEVDRKVDVHNFGCGPGESDGV